MIRLSDRLLTSFPQVGGYKNRIPRKVDGAYHLFEADSEANPADSLFFFTGSRSAGSGRGRPRAQASRVCPTASLSLQLHPGSSGREDRQVQHSIGHGGLLHGLPQLPSGVTPELELCRHSRIVEKFNRCCVVSKYIFIDVLAIR